MGKSKKINIQIFETGKKTIHIEGSEKESFFIKNEKDEIFTPGSLSYGYAADLPIYTGARYGFYCKDNDKTIKMRPSYGKFSPLTGLKNSFFCSEGFIIKSVSNEIRVYADSFKTRWASQRRLNKELQEKGPSDVLAIRKEAKKLQNSGKPIWILSDRTDKAGDNGEALFKYLMSSDAKDKYDMYFLIEESSPDYIRMQQYGKVIPFGSREHQVKELAAEMVISSSGEDWVFNPFKKDYKYFRDLRKSKFVFLQHGVIKDDLSGWLNKLNKNMAIFVTSVKDEYDSICNTNYGYGPDVVKMTGLPRYDKLHNERKKIIAFCPSWRKSIAANLIPGTSDREYLPEFKESDYFKFYNALINDERLLAAMRKKGYTGVFYLHPNHIRQAVDFKENDVISVWDGIANYSKIFNESALLTTDFSSVAIDFAYLKKPVIYTQFDRDSFYETHSYVEGYYDYERDGFGPVCYDLDSSVSATIQAIETDCKTEKKYEERIDRFFAYNDQNNCERVFQEILKL